MVRSVPLPSQEGTVILRTRVIGASRLASLANGSGGKRTSRVASSPLCAFPASSVGRISYVRREQHTHVVSRLIVSGG
jgi:hypothetical protein